MQEVTTLMRNPFLQNKRAPADLIIRENRIQIGLSNPLGNRNNPTPKRFEIRKHLMKNAPIFLVIRGSFELRKELDQPAKDYYDVEGSAMEPHHPRLGTPP
jgi:hypothetical protein